MRFWSEPHRPPHHHVHDVHRGARHHLESARSPLSPKQNRRTISGFSAAPPRSCMQIIAAIAMMMAMPGRPYNGADWTEMDIDDLKAAIESARSIEEAAEFLCRADSVNDVARKCEELGLKPKVRCAVSK